MSDIHEGSPDRSQFNYVLVHPAWEPVLAYHFHAYDEVAISRKIKVRGRDRHALFPLKETTRDRAKWAGWQDVTEDFLRDPALYEIPLDEPVPKHIAEVADRSMESWKDRILTALAIHGPNMQKQAILDATGIPEQLYKDLMPVLVTDGVVKKTGEHALTSYELVL